MGSGASQRSRTVSRTMSKATASVLASTSNLHKYQGLGSLAPMPKPVCAECGAVDRSSQHRSLEQRRLCAACWRASDSLPLISEKKCKGTVASHASMPSKGGNKYCRPQWSPLPLMANATQQPTSSMGPIAKSTLRGSGPVAMDCGASYMKR